jgi:thiamine biosynthesis lipoprotein
MTSPSKLKHKWQFEAIGTSWSIETARPLGDFQQEIAKRIDEYDQTYSRFRTDSLVTKIGQTAGRYHFPADAEKMISLYRSLYDATDGAVSPLVGSALSEAGYDREYSLAPGIVHDVPAWDDVMQWSGVDVATKRPVLLDFGAAGKGYLVDIVADIIKQGGHDIFVIDASGDIYIYGTSQEIGLENPYDNESVVGVARVGNASLCASATNRRAWGEWHHVIDAKTARPTNDYVATWVVAESAMVADGLATALFFVDPDKLYDWDFEYVRLDNHGRIEKSQGFVGELFA